MDDTAKLGCLLRMERSFLETCSAIALLHSCFQGAENTIVGSLSGQGLSLLAPLVCYSSEQEFFISDYLYRHGCNINAPAVLFLYKLHISYSFLLSLPFCIVDLQKYYQ